MAIEGTRSTRAKRDDCLLSPFCSLTLLATKKRELPEPQTAQCARVNEKPFADPERAQKWRLSLASLLFLTVLLSDHLWLCAEAKLKPDELSPRDTDERPAASRGHAPSLHFPPSSLPPNESVTFLWDSAKGLWGQGTCRPDSSSENCFTFDDAKSLCEGLSGVQGMHLNLSDLYLSFCNTYSLLDLFYGLSRVDSLNCSLDMVKDGDVMGCSRCVQAYQRFDQQAQEIYEDFEVMAQKYDTDVYSVRTCMEECKVRCRCFISPHGSSG
ncbi:transmembrane protein FAM155A-like [Arapaima gigas]